MNKAEYMDAVKNAVIKQDRVDAITNIYGIQVNDTIAGIVSVADLISFFDEERRALAYAEILNPVEYMNIDFVTLQAIPLIDAYDNTYIVYMIREKKWAKYNSIDNVFFKKKDSFSEVL
ncbi:hypothetical protein [Ruminococcus flavefaciens]|uniref:hypothetical protein n=1 Tax=Ruminococcus flavefaciens TaxID=1265 RepID=UPI000379E130|nr:hypothetical protein [Ruminococcus flavefaciens]